MLTCLSICCIGQSTILGSVNDENGLPIPGANVMIMNSYDGATSSTEGTFQFSTVEKGVKVVTVTYVGYKTFERQVSLDGTKIHLTIVLREKINQLDAVVISAGSFTAGEESRKTILKALDIATTAGATADIAGALNTLPGTQKVGESGRLFVRGGDGNETRTFIDGLVVFDAYGPAAPNTPSRGRFLPFMFKGTSFSTGGYSAEYGQALSSALALDSKDKAELNQTDIGLLSVGADVAHTHVWNRSSLSAKLEYTDIRPYYHLMNQVTDWKTPPVAIEASTAFRKRVGKTGLLKVFGNYSSTNYALYDHDMSQPYTTELLENTNSYGYGNAAYQQALSEKWNMRGGISYSYIKNEVVLSGDVATDMELGVHTKLIFENTLSDKIELRLGGEVITRTYGNMMSDSLRNELIKRRFEETIYSPFVEVQTFISNNLVAKGGIRFEYDDLNNKQSVDPRFSIAYKPGSTGQFSFAYGRFRQSAKNVYLIEDGTLSSERAEHFILNFQIINNQRTFRVESYYKRYFNLIKFADQGKLLTNDGKGYARGIEVFWRDNKSLRNIDYWVSYSLLDTKRDYLDFPVSATPAFASRHNFSLVYKHFISQIHSQVGITYSFASGRPYYNPNAKAFNSDRTPSYHDVSANFSFLPTNWLIIHTSCSNLLGRNNIFGYKYASTADGNGIYRRQEVTQPAKHFLFLGLFITISKNKSVNQLPNL